MAKLSENVASCIEPFHSVPQCQRPHGKRRLARLATSVRAACESIPPPAFVIVIDCTSWKLGQERTP
jgi:hypothetical protein